MVGLPSMAKMSHLWPWYGPSWGDLCEETGVKFCSFSNMCVCARLQCTYVFDSMNIKPVAKH